jgi:hypothetical protein
MQETRRRYSMTWDAVMEEKYRELFSGVMWEATELPSEEPNPTFCMNIVKDNIDKLENGHYEEVQLLPEDHRYLTYLEMRHLHLMRIACIFYTERLEVFPWRLRNKSFDELRPLLSFCYQGFHRIFGSFYAFEGVWDVNPGQRMIDAIRGYALMMILRLSGAINTVPTREYDMIMHLIQSIRDSGWGHVRGNWEQYEGYLAHNTRGYGTYDFEDIREVKKSGCHIMANYLVALLRSFNIAAHIGPGFGDSPRILVNEYNNDEYGSFVHNHGHCYVHFSSIGLWFTHGDDVYSQYLKGIPPRYSFKSDRWMDQNHFGTTGYEWGRASLYEEVLWWCVLLGQSRNYWYDVRSLYNANTLRYKLEHLHDPDYSNLANYDGAPSPVPPLFDAPMVDALIAWVEEKLAEEQESP